MWLTGPPWTLASQKHLEGHSVLSHKERDRLEDTHCRYTPFRASGEAKIYIAPAPAYEGTLNNVRSLLAAFNTALDDTKNTLYAPQQQIFIL
jgi:hypothetical protein